MDTDQTARRKLGATVTVGRYPDLEGQVAVVTGSAKGIGAEIARRFAAEKMRIVLADIDAPSLAVFADELRELGTEVESVVGDISRPEDVTNLFERAVGAFGTVDVLINNAAHLGRERLLNADLALLELQLATNIAGPYLCSQAAAGLMRIAGSGSIVNISSVGALQAHHRGFPYDVTKGAVNAMTRAMAVDLGEYGVRVNAIGPGLTQTFRTDVSSPKYAASASQVPLQRFGTATDVAAAAAFLASEEASYITGQVIYVDGGMTAQLGPKTKEAFE